MQEESNSMENKLHVLDPEIEKLHNFEELKESGSEEGS